MAGLSDFFRRLVVRPGASAPGADLPPGTPATPRFLGRSPHNAYGPYGTSPASSASTAAQIDAMRAGLTPVSSSWILAVAWRRDVGRLGTLRIMTRESGTMVYKGVPEDVYDDMFAASSQGEFYNNYIKGRYTYMGKR